MERVLKGIRYLLTCSNLIYDLRIKLSFHVMKKLIFKISNPSAIDAHLISTSTMSIISYQTLCVKTQKKILLELAILSCYIK